MPRSPTRPTSSRNQTNTQEYYVVEETEEQAKERRFQQQEKRRLAAIKAEQERKGRSPASSVRSSPGPRVVRSSVRTPPAPVRSSTAAGAATTTQTDNAFYDTMEVEDEYTPDDEEETPSVAHNIATPTSRLEQLQQMLQQHQQQMNPSGHQQPYHHTTPQPSRQQPQGTSPSGSTPSSRRQEHATPPSRQRRLEEGMRMVQQEYDCLVLLAKKKTAWNMVALKLRSLADHMEIYIRDAETIAPTQLEAMDKETKSMVSLLLNATQDLNAAAEDQDE